MAELRDILQRTAANISLDEQELEPFAQTILKIFQQAIERGEDVELMTFGTLVHESGTVSFRPHASLIPPQEDGPA